MMLLVPLYFQVSAHASVTNAGAHLMPSVIGNAFGGLLTGFVIRRYNILSLHSTPIPTNSPTELDATN